jgi:hypothetical protein
MCVEPLSNAIIGSTGKYPPQTIGKKAIIENLQTYCKVASSFPECKRKANGYAGDITYFRVTLYDVIIIWPEKTRCVVRSIG